MLSDIKNEKTIQIDDFPKNLSGELEILRSQIEGLTPKNSLKTNHLGQLAFLRNLAGKTEKIIEE